MVEKWSIGSPAPPSWWLMDGNSGSERSHGGLIAGLHLCRLQPSILWESLRTWERSQVTLKPINLLNVYPVAPLQDPPGRLLCPDHFWAQNVALKSLLVKSLFKAFYCSNQENVLLVSIWKKEVVCQENLCFQSSLHPRVRVSTNQMVGLGR